MRRFALAQFGVAALAFACGASQTGSSGLDLDESEIRELKPARSQRAPFLWRVTPAKGGPSSFVLGTIHVGFSASELSPEVWRALESTQVFAMETDVHSASSAESTAPPARQVLSATAWQWLVELVGPGRAELLADEGVDAVYGVVLQSLFPRVRASMDLELAASASARGAQVRFLEDWRLQVALGQRYFDKDELAEVLDPSSDARAELQALVDSYRHGDLAFIERMALDPAEVAKAPTRYRELFFDRNERWADRASPWLRSTSCFIAVGVGHLPGQRGLLRLLDERGFRVERVTPDSN